MIEEKTIFYTCYKFHKMKVYVTETYEVINGVRTFLRGTCQECYGIGD